MVVVVVVEVEVVVVVGVRKSDKQIDKQDGRRSEKQKDGRRGWYWRSRQSVGRREIYSI
jgi:hypothetical protein